MVLWGPAMFAFREYVHLTLYLLPQEKVSLWSDRYRTPQNITVMTNAGKNEPSWGNQNSMHVKRKERGQ